MHQNDKVIPITRGKRARLQLRVSSGPSSVQYLLQPTSEPMGAAANPRRRLHQQGPGKLLPFKPRTQKESKT